MVDNKEIKEALEKATYIKNGKTFNYSKSTINGYIAKYNKVKGMTFKEIVDKYKHLANGYLSAILTISKNVRNIQLTKEKQLELLELISDSNVQSREIAYKKTITEKSISLEDIRNKRNSYDNNTQEYLLLSFYLEFPVRDDFWNMRIVKRKPKYNTGNYINISKRGSSITLNEYKTKNIYGTKTFKVPKELRDLVIKSLEKEPRKLLFTSNKGTKYDDGLSDKILKKFGFGINEIRRAYINDLLEKKGHTLKEREYLSTRMLSSTVQQTFTYKREEKTINKKQPMSRGQLDLKPKVKTINQMKPKSKGQLDLKPKVKTINQKKPKSKGEY
tara:strand:+ start:248 stop:1240 length:993 start_codon:yes stop_codon:yes gene_type:complete